MTTILFIMGLIFMIGQFLILLYMMIHVVRSYGDEHYYCEYPPGSRPAEPAYVAVHHRAAGSSSLYFGPFATIKELEDWTKKAQLSHIGYFDLIEPYAWAELPYEQRWSYPLYR